ncbi:MAG: aminodeoxychorismate synthase component I, partial [Kiloniellaceae bacterium]
LDEPGPHENLPPRPPGSGNGPASMPAIDPRSMTDDRAAPRPRAGPAPAPFVLLDDSLSPGGVFRLLDDPGEIVRCDRPADVERALAALEDGLARGLSAAGFFAYELGYLLEPRLAGLIPRERDVPLIWMGLFERPRELSAARARREIAARAAGGGHAVEHLRLGMERAAYLEALARVKDYIAAGDVYQINLTFKVLFDFAGDPLSLYDDLRRKQRVAHGGLVHAPEFDILSLSPELFLSVRDRRALTKPMKGTAARRPMPEADGRARAWLKADEKSRAENLMIVDLLRNDLSRVAETGSVQVPALFTVETYPTVHQMTSSVTGHLRPDVGLRELIGSLFPCGSITGAPKVRAMEIIRELEPGPRGVYTGALGMLGPDGEVALNVAIRTLVLHRDGRGEMGIGSGIVFDSDPNAEFDECLLKARFLTEPREPFQLIETLAWTPDEGYTLFDRHLARLAASAAYFGTPCDTGAVRQALLDRAESFPPSSMRVRLLLDQDGEIEISDTPLAPPGAAAHWRYAISPRTVDRDD